MLSRALSLATVMLLTGFATLPAHAQNLEAGKSASQIFAGGCAVCHKSPRGLLKTVAPGALPGFLRQHYTTSTDMAASLSAYVISNGAADRRPAGDNLTRQGRELSTERPAAAPADEPATGRRRRPSAAEGQPAAEQPAQAEPTTRTGRNARRRAAPVETPETAKPDAARPDAAVPAAEEARPASRKQKVGKKGRRQQEETPKADSVTPQPKVAPAAEPVAPKEEAKPAPKPVEETSKPEPKPDPAPLRADPVPPVTPAPAPVEAAPAPAPTPAAPATAPAAPTPAPTPSAPATTPAPEAPAPSAPAAPAAPQ